MRSRGKDILLLVLALAALLVAFYTFQRKPRGAAAPAGQTPATSAEATEKPAEAGESASTAKGPGAEEASPAGAATQAARNPFAAPGSPAKEGAAPPEGAAPAPGAAEGSVEPAPAAPAAQQTPAAPALKLTGIVAGRPAVAIIRDDGERYFVRVGDYVRGGYRVHAIGRQEVVLAGPQGQVTLTMGGRQ